MKLSIIIPVYQESVIITQTIQSITALSIPIAHEILVVDGDPKRSTLAELRSQKKRMGYKQIRLIPSQKGRGIQMNAGAQKADGDLFLFLHADTQLDQKGMNEMIQAWTDTRWMKNGQSLFCGAFDLIIDSPKKIFRLIEKTASLRSRLTRVPYGDQGIFISRSLFKKTGGFPNTPIMEDVGLMKAVKRTGIAPVFMDHGIVTSARRWEHQGLIYTTMKNWVLICLYLMGVSPKKLVKYY